MGPCGDFTKQAVTFMLWSSRSAPQTGQAFQPGGPGESGWESLTRFLGGVLRIAAHHSHAPTEPKPPVTFFRSQCVLLSGQRDLSGFVAGA